MMNWDSRDIFISGKKKKEIKNFSVKQANLNYLLPK